MIDDKLLDLSNWDNDTFDALCFKANGVRNAIVAGDRTTSKSQVQRLQGVGIRVIGLYSYLYWGRDPWGVTPHARTEACIRLAKDRGIPYVWLDAEDTERGTPTSRRTELQQCVDLVTNAGLKAGIYTGAWWWRDYIGDTTQFKHLPLWHAAYGPNNSPAQPATSVNYGGWTAPHIHQYTSAVVLCGRVRDHNYWLKPLPGIDDEEDELSAEDRKFLHELGARVTQLEANIWPLQKAVGGNGYVVDGETLTNWDAIDALHTRGISLAQFMANLNAAVIEMRKGGNKDFDPRVTEKLQEIVDIMEGK